MKSLNTIFGARICNLCAAPLAMLTLSACVYGDDIGQYNSGISTYGADEYCDPYNEYDAYYGCDVEYGFANIGYSGGWHQDFYYPGFGFFIFDNAGRRFRMNDYYRSYWGARRHDFFRSRFSDKNFSGRKLRRFFRDDKIRRENLRQNREDRLARRQERRVQRRTNNNENQQIRRRAAREGESIRLSRDQRRARNSSANRPQQANAPRRQSGQNRVSTPRRQAVQSRAASPSRPAIKKPSPPKVVKPPKPRRVPSIKRQNQPSRTGRGSETWRNVKPE